MAFMRNRELVLSWVIHALANHGYEPDREGLGRLGDGQLIEVYCEVKDRLEAGSEPVWVL